MCGVQKVSIVTVHVEEVLEHTEHKARNGKCLAKERAGTELGGNSDEQGNGQCTQKSPPLGTPLGNENRHQYSKEGQYHYQNRAGDECLLDSFINEIKIAMNKCTWNLG